MIKALLIIAMIVFAVQSIRARQLLISAVWLALVSALLSVLIYLYGAPIVAVIELSVGAGLVTVFFVFSVAIAGEDAVKARSLVPKPLAIGLPLLLVLLLAWFLSAPLTAPGYAAGATEPALSVVLWEQRGLDMLVQVVILFSGTLGILGLLAESKPPLDGAFAAEVAATREDDLAAMEHQSRGAEVAETVGSPRR
jgi:NADH:ubiquinone oxidoreductase subunit 6 (subunit J)